MCFHFLCFLPFISACCEHVQHSNSTLTLVIIISFVSNLHTNRLLLYILRLVSIFILKVIICCHVATRICFVNLIFSSWFVMARTSNPMQQVWKWKHENDDKFYGRYVWILGKWQYIVVQDNNECYWIGTILTSYNFELLMTKEVND